MQMISRETGIIKDNVISFVGAQVEWLLESDPQTEQEAEELVWRFILPVVRILLAVLLARRCWRVTVAELTDHSLSPSDVSFRLEPNYWAVLSTTFGGIVVPWFTFRHKTGGKPTRTASRSVLPLHPRCHSSTLLLRWEALLGTHAVFGTAERLLGTLTHGAVSLEDTTIASHCEVMGLMVDRSLMYLLPEAIREHLHKYAAVDEETGFPLLNVSTDAHNERCYVEDTWEAKYRNTHAIRIWYTDRRTGHGVTVGCEFIVGDSDAVVAAFDDLVARGILPANGDYGAGVVAQLVFVADGMPWFKERIVPKFPGMVTVLDNKHLLGRILTTLKAILRKGSPKIQLLYGELCQWITGRRPGSKKPAGIRATGPGSRPGNPPKGKLRNYPSWDPAQLAELGLPSHYGGALVAKLTQLPEAKTNDQHQAVESLLNYAIERVNDIRYAEFSQRGITISSAPIESLHRVAQSRVKLSGQTWTPQKLQAVLNLRVINYLGHEPLFWAQQAVAGRLRTRFEDQLAARSTARQVKGAA
jgi:hypothetical protein